MASVPRHSQAYSTHHSASARQWRCLSANTCVGQGLLRLACASRRMHWCRRPLLASGPPRAGWRRRRRCAATTSWRNPMSFPHCSCAVENPVNIRIEYECGNHGSRQIGFVLDASPYFRCVYGHGRPDRRHEHGITRVILGFKGGAHGRVAVGQADA
jgi:hypothetical protein